MGKKKNTSIQTKASKLKVYRINKFGNAIGKEGEKVCIAALGENTEISNACSERISESLTTRKIGDLYSYIPESSKNTKYANLLISEKWADKPLYEMFYDGYHRESRNNTMFLFLKDIYENAYKSSNIFGLPTTYYFRNGIVYNLVANYCTKIKSVKSKTKKKSLSENPTEAELISQSIYEIDKHGIVNNADFKEYIDALEKKSEVDPKYMSRIKTLYEFYCNNVELVEKARRDSAVESLANFNGCTRQNQTGAMVFQGSTNTKFTITRSGDNFFNLKFGDILDLDLYGRRDIVKNGMLINDICNNHGKIITLMMEKDELYVVITYDSEYKKELPSNPKYVGIDMNVKHNYIMTNLEDNGEVKNYLNIYKEILKDKEFVSTLSKSEYDYYKDASTKVSFGPIEADLLFSRITQNNDIKKEHAFSNALQKLADKLFVQKKNRELIYVKCTIKKRAKIKAYDVLNTKYYELQKKYDLSYDENYRMEHPFNTTEQGMEILNKKRNVVQDIKGCDYNIISYAYMVLAMNGYNTIALENLENPNFDKLSFPTINSILDYHKIRGIKLEDLENTKVYNVIKKGYYEFITDNDNVIIDAKYTEKGIKTRRKNNFYNMLPKCCAFASAKDIFIEITNNTNTTIAFVPPFYTSLMDSKTNTIYTEDGKTLPKKKIRKTQEMHRNGLNADFNAACNIVHFVENENWKKDFLTANAPKYGTPVFTSKHNSSTKMLTVLMKKYGVEIKD